MAKKKIFISDVHIGDGRFHNGNIKDEYKYDWEWLSKEETENFANFLGYLRENYIDSIEEVAFLGDLFDNWIVPFDLIPPTISDIIEAPKNKTIVDELGRLSKIVSVFYVPGNHDMGATQGVMNQYFPKITYCAEQFVDGRLIAEHGHRYALFNAPPFFSNNVFGLPLGYFISRVEATKKARTNDESRQYRTYVDNFIETLSKQKLPQSVFEAVLEEAGLSENIIFKIKMKSGYVETVSAKVVKDVYKNIYEDWPDKVVSSPRAVFAELDRLGPIADKLCKNGKAKVCVFGHSHKAELDKDTWFCDERIYANAGFWCGEKCTLVAVEKKTSGGYCVELLKWSGSSINRLEKASVK